MDRMSITADPSVTTVISTFTVRAGKQADLLRLLAANSTWLGALPGFIAVSLHPSDDGTKIVNYAQWRSKDALATMLGDPAMAEHRRHVNELASVEAVRYSVNCVHLGLPLSDPRST